MLTSDIVRKALSLRNQYKKSDPSPKAKNLLPLLSCEYKI